MARVGIGEASTFPGFCDVHESLFTEYEAAGAISSAKHIALQTFRSICREITKKRHQIESHERALSSYLVAREQFYQSVIASEFPDAKFHSSTFKDDRIEDLIRSNLEQLRRDVSELETGIYSEIIDYLEKGSPEPSIVGLIVPIQIPVSLSGLGVINFVEHSKEGGALCVMNVVPQGTKTVLLIGATLQHERLIHPWSAVLSSAVPALNMIESWMINGSDHWFIRPSVWNQLPEGRKQAVLDAIFQPDNIAFETPLSVFDEVREKLLRKMERELAKSGKQDDAASALIAKERAKICK
jgi:hypothetical protein